MSTHTSFKQGKTSEKVLTLLEHVQHAHPGSPEIDKDNKYLGWGHDQFMAGGITLSTSLTCWQDVGNVSTAFKLAAAAIKMCREDRLMCANAGTPKKTGFISDVYLVQILELLEKCWVSAGGVHI